MRIQTRPPRIGYASTRTPSYLALLLGLVLLLSACSGEQDSTDDTSTAEPTATSTQTDESQPDEATTTAPQTGTSELVVIETAEPPGLEPTTNVQLGFASVQRALYEGLTRFDEDLNVQPLLATEWRQLEDGSWEFALREDVTFHDGSAFDAEAVVFSLERVIDPDGTAIRQDVYSVITEIEAVTANRVRIVTDPLLADLPALLADRSAVIISPTAMEAQGIDGFNRNPIGTGPYQFGEWLTGQFIRLTPFAEYWGRPSATDLQFRYVGDAAARTAALQTGDADIVFDLPVRDLPSIEDTEGVSIARLNAPSIFQLELKQALPPFDDERVRRAINLAVDLDAIVDNILEGAGVPVRGPGLPSFPDYGESEPYAFDSAEAERLLDEAGYGEGLEVTISYVAGRFAGDEELLEAVQAYLAQVGITAGLEPVAAAEFSGIANGDPTTQPGLMYLVTRIGLYQMYNLERLYSSTAAPSGFSDSEVDQLISEIAGLREGPERSQAIQDLQETIWDRSPFLYLFHPINTVGFRTEAMADFYLLPSNELIPSNSQ